MTSEYKFIFMSECEHIYIAFVFVWISLSWFPGVIMRGRSVIAAHCGGPREGGRDGAHSVSLSPVIHHRWGND
jgi:hypothetical protein